MHLKLILASNNQGKIREIRQLLPQLEILSLRDIGYNAAIPEPFETFRENAHIKADTIHRLHGGWVLSDDSGICVERLDGAPGVSSARYAGDGASDAANNARLLQALDGISDRRAYYFAVLCLIAPDGAAHYFEGRCDGTIAQQLQGTGGFGYDPLFIPEGYERSFGELPDDLKSRLSHRSGALRKLAASGLFQNSVHS